MNNDIMMKLSRKDNYNVYVTNTILDFVPNFEQIFCLFVCLICRYSAGFAVGCGGAGEPDHDETLRQTNTFLSRRCFVLIVVPSFYY